MADLSHSLCLSASHTSQQSASESCRDPLSLSHCTGWGAESERFVMMPALIGGPITATVNHHLSRLFGNRAGGGKELHLQQMHCCLFFFLTTTVIAGHACLILIIPHHRASENMNVNEFPANSYPRLFSRRHVCAARPPASCHRAALQPTTPPWAGWPSPSFCCWGLWSLSLWFSQAWRRTLKRYIREDWVRSILMVHMGTMGTVSHVVKPTCRYVFSASM